MTDKSANDIALGYKVMNAMLQIVKFKSGIVKYTIPDDIFSGSRVKVNGVAYDVNNIPGIKNSGPHNVIEYAIEIFNKTNGAPTWSQIVSASPDLYRKLPQSPKTVYLKV